MEGLFDSASGTLDLQLVLAGSAGQHSRYRTCCADAPQVPVENACHACDKKGKITVSTFKETSGNILVSVEDNGKGIEKKNLSRIFDPFFTTKPVGQGTGLGLSVGYGIIKRHHGDIDVKSELGSGSLFTVSLPQFDESNEHAAS